MALTDHNRACSGLIFVLTDCMRKIKSMTNILYMLLNRYPITLIKFPQTALK